MSVERDARLDEINRRLSAGWPQLGLRLRAEVAEDLRQSAALYALTREAEMAGVDWPAAARSAFCKQQFDAQHAHYRQHYPRACFAMVMRADDTVGRIYFEQTERELRLMEITLQVSARNHGAGTALTAALLEHARQQGLFMGLHVEPFNPARRLYERLGFRCVEERGVYLYLCTDTPA